jgi:cyanate lyase
LRINELGDEHNKSLQKKVRFPTDPAFFRFNIINKMIFDESLLRLEVHLEFDGGIESAVFVTKTGIKPPR